MSQQNTLPEKEVALLVEKVQLPAMLEKLARDWHIYPRTQAEVGQLLETADLLREAKAREHVKQASEGDPFIAGALDGLRQALGAEGMQVGPTRQEDQLKEASFKVTSGNPDVAHAALAYAEFLAAQEAGR